MTDQKPSRMIHGAEQGKMVRAALKQAFPGIKFSVTSKDCIRVCWTNGPTKKDVATIVDTFAGGKMVSGEDYCAPRNTYLGDERISFINDFTFCERTITPDFIETTRKALAVLPSRTVTDLLNMAPFPGDDDIAKRIAHILPVVVAQPVDNLPTVR
ncbi:MAG: hypothetical protein EOP83_09020 [Verrucomicrobiaceae bacterium]|nr:MAG: hypothetical protein EOP83_09020 [Verrucomicrobiaceae bacterium]